MIPLRTKNPPERFPFVTIGLIVINVVVFAITAPHAVLSAEVLAIGGLSPSNVNLTRFISSLFLHQNLWHIFFNMLFLWIFGSAVEGRLKWYRFASLYLMSGIAAGLAQLIFSSSNSGPMIGASGAVMGVVGMSMVLFPYAPVSFLWPNPDRSQGPVFDLPMWMVGIFYVMLDVIGVVQSTWTGGNVAHMAHLGGAIFGAVAMVLLGIPRDSRSASIAKESIHGGMDYSSLELKDLDQMAAHQAHNPLITLAWVHRSLTDRGELSPRALTRFNRQFPRMARQANSLYVATTLLMVLNDYPESVLPRDVCRLATRCEQEGFPYPAMQLYDWVLQCPFKTEDDDETALFQLAVINERWMRNYETAQYLYIRLIERHPMSPLTHPARMSLTVVQDQLGRP